MIECPYCGHKTNNTKIFLVLKEGYLEFTCPSCREYVEISVSLSSEIKGTIKTAILSIEDKLAELDNLLSSF
jgi:phage FluMu protein Com